MHVGNLWKKLTIDINDGSQAQIMLKLKYDNLTLKGFVKKMLQAYADDNKHMRQMLYEINQDKVSRASMKRMMKEQKEKQKVIETFGLNEQEIEDIFDAIQNEETEP